MSRIAVFPHTKIFVKGNTVGPSSRIWELSKALQRKGHNVTIAEKERRKSDVKDKIKFVPWDKELLTNLSKKYDVVLTQIWCSDQDFLDGIQNIPLAVDVSAPILIELSDYFSSTYSSVTSHQIKHYMDDILIPTSMILSRGDFFVCANERQKHYYQGVLNVLGRLSPYTYRKKLIDVVPFGVSLDEPKHTKNVFGEVVGKKDRVILWPGAFFPWFDPSTAIEAMGVVSKKVPDSKLVFVGSLNPRAPRSLTYKNVKKAKEKAKKLGLLNKSVFFVDWLPYEERGNMYPCSEFAVVTSNDNLESELSHRTRIIDCLGGRLPVICTEGDSVAEVVKREGLGAVIRANDPKVLAERIIAFIKNKTELERMSKRIDKFVQKELSWDKAIEPLHKFCSKPEIDGQKGKITSFAVIDEKENRIEEMKSEIQKRDKQLQDIFESRGWKFLTGVHNVKKKMGLVKE